MTFKHVKFEDSAVMRSLEKVAREKGLVKQQDLVKSAAPTKSTNLNPTDNFTMNIVKLCSGLREQGFDKYANELEDKFLVYKQAQTLYETSKETGDDLVDAAHPKGSHKLEDVDGDSTFETILDQQLKDLEMVNKKPTGKLSSSQDIFNAVKQVLGGRFLENGRANGSRKIAQESSNIGTGVAETAGVMGGLALLKYVYTKLKSMNALDAKTIKFTEEQMGRKLTNAEAKQLTKMVTERASKEAMEKAFGEIGAKNLAKSVGSEALKDVGGVAAKNVGTAATESAGAWSRIMSLLGRAGTSAAELGAVEVGGGAVGVAGSIAAAALIGGLIGGLTSNYLFNKYQEPAEIKDAGDLLIESADNISSELPVPAREAIINFKSAYTRVLRSYPILKQLEENKNPQDLKGLKVLNDALWESNKQAQIIWSYARSSLDEQWYNPRGMLGGSVSGLVTKSNNYMTRSKDKAQIGDKLISDVAEKAYAILAEKSKANIAAKGGSEVQQLLVSYRNAAQEIMTYIAKVKAKRPANQAQIVAWLTDMVEYINEEAKEFSSAQVADKKEIIGPYLERLNNDVRVKMDAFKTEAVKQGWV